MLLANMLTSLSREPQLYSTFQVSSETSRAQVLPINHCGSRSVFMMLYAHGVTSVPVCRCIVWMSSLPAGLYQFTSTAWMCHRAVLVKLSKCIVVGFVCLFFLLLWSSSTQKLWRLIFNWEMDDIHTEKCVRTVTSSRVSQFNSSMPRLCQYQIFVIEHACQWICV